MSNKQRKLPPNTRPVRIKSPTGIVSEHQSIRQAAAFISAVESETSPTNVRLCAHGVRKSVKGFTVEFVEATK